MKENSIKNERTSIKEDINYLNSMVKEYKQFGNLYSEEYEDEDRIYQALEHILSEIPNKDQGIEILMETNVNLTDELNNSIPKQKIKDIIDRIDYDIKKTKEIISKNTNVHASYRKNDYQILRLRAMNTKSLDIKKRLQELLESEE